MISQRQRFVLKWLTPTGLLCNLSGAILVAWSSSAFIGLVKQWALAADPAKGPSLPLLSGREGASFAAQHSDVLSYVGWSILCLGYVMQIVAWWFEPRR